MISLFGLSSAEVIGRFVFNHPLPWAPEVCRFLLIWMIFLGASEVTRRRGHLTVGVSVARFVSPASFRKVSIFTNLCVAVVLGTIAWYGGQAAYFASHISAPASGIPMWWVWAAVPVNFTLMLFFILRDIFGLIRGVVARTEDVMVSEEK